MARPPTASPIRRFRAIAALEESTDMGLQVQQARNIMLRPAGGFKGIPKYERLWAIGAEETIHTWVTSQPHPTESRNLDSTDQTVALQISRQGKNFLVFYSIPDQQARSQVFYLGDDGSYTSGAYDFLAGTATVNVLGTGYDSAARWHGRRFYSAIYLGNGVDDNLIAQLNRDATPGILRKAGSNARPAAPVISLVTPATGGNTQAFTEFARASGQGLRFTANADNYPGSTGNGKISVRLNPTGAASLVSSLSGEGTVSNPYVYTLQTGTAAASSSNAAVLAFVNADSKVLSILRASVEGTANADPDTGSYGPTLLAAGTGTGTSEGFTSRTVSCYARYWDPGVGGLGYEGPSSPKSNEVIIPAGAFNDISVVLAPDASAEGGRFPFIRVYMQFGEDAEAIWSLVEPDNPFPNAALAATGKLAAWPATDYLFSYSASQAVTPDVATDQMFVHTPGVPATGTAVFFLGDTMPGGVTAGKLYYALLSDGLVGFQISASVGGKKVNITTAGSNVSMYFPANHGLQNERDTVELTTSGTLPAPLATSTTYHVLDASGHQFKISASAGGAAVNVTTRGSGEHSYSATRSLFQIGTNTVFGQALVDDQNRPIPHKWHAMGNEQMWRAGVAGFPERLYASKQAVADELAPEGVDLASFLTVQSTGEQAGGGVISALTSDNFRLAVHTAAGITLIDPANVENRFDPAVFTGALSGSMVAVWKGALTYYLGADLQLYKIQSSRYGRQTSDFAALNAAAYIRERVDAAALSRQPDRCWMFPDTASQHLWFSLPALDGSLKMFAYDFRNEGIVGEFDFPKVYGSTIMEPERPEIIFCDEAMNLFVWDTTAQNDHGDTFGSVSPITSQPAASAIPVADAGFGNVVRAGRRYLRAYESVIETAFFDLGSPDRNKAVLAFLWRTVAGSRAIASVTLTSLAGQTLSFNYGDIGARVEHRLAAFLGGTTAVKFTFTLLSAGQKPWIVRDISFLHTPQAMR